MEKKKHHNALQPGYKLHWYVIKEVLGRGGFGITYLAQDTNLDRPVAIKEYLPVEFSCRDHTDSVNPIDAEDDPQYKWGLEKFIVEAQTLAKFEHPNIVRVISVFEENNTGYMVMNYERGVELQSLIKNGQTLEEQDLLKILFPLLDGLEYVHSAGFIHRDIKPQNIVIRPDGTPVLIDFGSARQSLGQKTKTLTSLVSPGYAPFEQYYSKSDKQGPWTDIYALAATLYRCISGIAPMSAVDRSESIVHGSGDIFVSAVELGRGRYSDGLLRAIDNGLKFKTEERPQSIGEWKRYLREITQPSSGIVIAEDQLPTLMAEPRIRNTSTRQVTRELQRKSKSAYIYGVLVVATAIGVILFLNKYHIPDILMNSLSGLTEQDEQAPSEKNILSLLSQAQLDFENQKYVKPNGDNAYFRYQQVIEADPDNILAQQGIQRITGKLIDLARQEIDSGNLLLAQDYMRQAGEIMPDSSELTELRALYDQKHRETLRAEIESQLLRKKETEEKEKQEQNKTLITYLLAQAETNINESRLTSPEGNNAYENYKKILELEPDNKEAKQGIRNITDKYLVFAREAGDAGAYDKAREYLSTAAAISPGSESVKAAREEISGKRKIEEQRKQKEAQKLARLKEEKEKQKAEEEKLQAQLREEEEAARLREQELEARRAEEEKQQIIEEAKQQARQEMEAALKQEELARQEEAKIAASKIGINIKGVDSKYQSMGLNPGELLNEINGILVSAGYNITDSSQAGSTGGSKVLDLIFTPTHAADGKLVKWAILAAVRQGNTVLWSARDERESKVTKLYGVDVEARGIDNLADVKNSFIHMVSQFAAKNRIQ